MNRCIVWGVVLFVGACAEVNRTDMSKEIQQLLMSQQKAWNAGNIEEFMEGYHRDSGMQFIGARGVRYGWIATLNAYKKNYPDKSSMGQLSFDIDTIEMLDKSGEIAHVNGRWKLIRMHDTPAGHFSLITRKISGKHKIIIDHTW
jgi:hypothetical protein